VPSESHPSSALRQRLLRWLVYSISATVLLTSALTTSLSSVVQAQESDPDCPESSTNLTARTEESAVTLARACDEAVEVLDWRSPVSQSFAMPDGAVRTEAYTQPQWTLDEQGAWVDIDPSLRVRDDGSISTTATVSSVSVSSGGTGPFVSIATPNGETLALVWPDELPEPRLEGNAAVYPSIQTDIDLRVEVEHRPHRPELSTHVLYVGHGPLVRVDAPVYRRVLRRKPKGVETYREEDTVSLHPDKKIRFKLRCQFNQSCRWPCMQPCLVQYSNFFYQHYEKLFQITDELF
jgi:hypothetical protein